MSKYFKMSELTRSGKADELGIDNTPSAEDKAHLEELMAVLDDIREYYGKSIRITSGYRCPKLNKAVNGSDTSAHKYGYAADMQPANDTLKNFVEMIKGWAEDKNFDQILIEKNSKGSRWVHFGLYDNKGHQRRELKNLYVE